MRVYDGAGSEKLNPTTNANLGKSEFISFGWAGMYHEELGLYHTHYREYDALHRRWLSEDPAGTVDGMNLYFCYSSVNSVDLLGLDTYIKGGKVMNKEYEERVKWYRAKIARYLKAAQGLAAQGKGGNGATNNSLIKLMPHLKAEFNFMVTWETVFNDDKTANYEKSLSLFLDRIDTKITVGDRKHEFVEGKVPPKLPEWENAELDLIKLLQPLRDNVKGTEKKTVELTHDFFVNYINSFLVKSGKSKITDLVIRFNKERFYESSGKTAGGTNIYLAKIDSKTPHSIYLSIAMHEGYVQSLGGEGTKKGWASYIHEDALLLEIRSYKTTGVSGEHLAERVINMTEFDNRQIKNNIKFDPKKYMLYLKNTKIEVEKILKESKK